MSPRRGGDNWVIIIPSVCGTFVVHILIDVYPCNRDSYEIKYSVESHSVLTSLITASGVLRGSGKWKVNMVCVSSGKIHGREGLCREPYSHFTVAENGEQIEGKWVAQRLIYLIFSRAETRNQVSQFHVPWGQRCRSSLKPGTVFPKLDSSLKQIGSQKVKGDRNKCHGRKDLGIAKACWLGSRKSTGLGVRRANFCFWLSYCLCDLDKSLPISGPWFLHLSNEKARPPRNLVVLRTSGFYKPKRSWVLPGKGSEVIKNDETVSVREQILWWELKTDPPWFEERWVLEMIAIPWSLSYLLEEFHPREAKREHVCTSEQVPQCETEIWWDRLWYAESTCLDIFPEYSLL